ncbi:MAG: 4-hydroxy-tetrahydrodipicolinate reductase [Dehalococcoidales bacterium]
MEPIRVVIQGASGRMGREIIEALCPEPDMKIVGAVEMKTTGDYLPLPDGFGKVPFSSDIDKILDTAQANVVVDFSIAKATMPAVRAAAKRGVNLVVGTTGFSSDELGEMERLAIAHKIGIVVAPNFALGAVLMIHLSKIAAKYMDYAEIIEQHHHLKADAPSGTAIITAKAMLEARGKPFSRPEQGEKTSNSRGEDIEGIAVHAVRLPGLMAHQEVILGTSGQTLRIRHDTINRECYRSGILLAIREVINRQGLTYGLDTLLNL